MTLALLLAQPARGEDWLSQVGFSDFSEYASQESGFDAMGFLRRLMTGGALEGSDDVGALLQRLGGRVRTALSEMLSRLLGPVLVCAMLVMIVGRGHRAAVDMASLACALCCALTLMEVFGRAQAVAAQLLLRLQEAAKRMTPVLVSACALTAAPTSASTLTSLSALCANALSAVLSDTALPLCGAGAVVAVAGSLSPGFPLKRLYGLVGSAVRWLLGGAMLGLGAMMSMSGMVCAARDSTTMRAARSALEALIPVIGGGVSDAAGSLMVSAAALRQAVGITGVAFIVSLCAEPVLELAAAMMAVKLVAALMEPVSAGTASALAGRFGEILEQVLAICFAGIAISALLAGQCALWLGGG